MKIKNENKKMRIKFENEKQKRATHISEKHNSIKSIP